VPVAQRAPRFMSIMVRGPGDPRALAPAIRAALAETDPDLALYWVRTLDEAMLLTTAGFRIIGTMFAIFAAIALLLAAGSGELTQDQLERRCVDMARRISMLYGLDAPEFFDRSMFRGFIGLLVQREVLQVDAGGNLVFGEPLLAVADDARLVLSEQIRNSILQVVHR